MPDPCCPYCRERHPAEEPCAFAAARQWLDEGGRLAVMGYPTKEVAWDCFTRKGRRYRSARRAQGRVSRGR